MKHSVSQTKVSIIITTIRLITVSIRIMLWACRLGSEGELHPMGVTASYRQPTKMHFHPTGWSCLYPYTADLLCLESACPSVRTTTPQLMGIHTPLDVREWIRTLDQHPDRAFAKYITNGLSNGFRIGFNRDTRLRAATSNMLSEHLPQVIADDLTVGPFPPTIRGSKDWHQCTGVTHK